MATRKGSGEEIRRRTEDVVGTVEEWNSSRVKEEMDHPD